MMHTWLNELNMIQDWLSELNMMLDWLSELKQEHIYTLSLAFSESHGHASVSGVHDGRAISGVSNTRPVGRMRPAALYNAAPDDILEILK